MKRRDKLIEIIHLQSRGAFNKVFEGKLADAILNSKLFCEPEDLKEQEPHVYRCDVVEDDGYRHSEAVVANNMLDAFWSATEYSPSYHKKIVIEKISDEELTAEEKEFKEYMTDEYEK